MLQTNRSVASLDVRVQLAGIVAADIMKDMFLLYCNLGRSPRATIRLTDTMYEKRAQVWGLPQTITRAGFLTFVADLSDMRSLVTPAESIFTDHIGYRPDLSVGLSYDQWLESLFALAVARYPTMLKQVSLIHFGIHQLLPLAEALFGTPAVPVAAMYHAPIEVACDAVPTAEVCHSREPRASDTSNTTYTVPLRASFFPQQPHASSPSLTKHRRPSAHSSFAHHFLERAAGVEGSARSSTSSSSGSVRVSLLVTAAETSARAQGPGAAAVPHLISRRSVSSRLAAHKPPILHPVTAAKTATTVTAASAASLAAFV